MRTWLKLLLGLALIGAGVAALIYLRRKVVSTTPTTTAETSPALASRMWAISDALQQSQLTNLTGLVADRVTRSDVAIMIQQAIAALPTGSNPTNPTTSTDVDFAALFEQQMN